MNSLLNRRRVGFVVAATAIVCSLALWQSAARATQNATTQIAPPSVAIVNVDTVIYGLDELPVRQGMLQARQAQRQEQAQALEKQIEAIRTQIQEDELTDDQMNEALIRGIELEGQLQGFRNAAQGAAQAEQQQLFSDLYNKLTEAVEAAAERMSIDLVLVDDSTLKPPAALTGRRILYRNDRLDITEIVLNDMNAAYAAGANP